MKTAEESRKETEENEIYQTLIKKARLRLAEKIDEAIENGETRCYKGGSWSHVFIPKYDKKPERAEWVAYPNEKIGPYNIQNEMVEWVQSLGYYVIWNYKTTTLTVKQVGW